MTPRAIILDFDGVVVESESVKDDTFRDLFARYPDHLLAAVSFHEANRALPRRSKFEHLVFELLGRRDDEALVQALVTEFGALAVARVAACPLVPGARELLERCAADHLPAYLASVTPRDDLLKILGRQGLHGYFSEVFGDPPTSKAEAIEQVLRVTGAPRGDVVLVGDTVSDLRVASAAGIRFIGRQVLGTPTLGQPSFPDLFGVLDSLDDPADRRGGLLYRE